MGCYYNTTVRDKRSQDSLVSTDPSATPTPGFINGETVTTPEGIVIKGTFGEIAQRKVLDNGVVIEAVFE